MHSRSHLTILAAGATLTLSAASIAWGGAIRGDGKFVEVSRPVGAFHAVEVSSGIQVELLVGEARPIEIHAEENIAPLVETEVSGSTLHIRFTPNTSHSDEGVKVKVVAPRIDRIEVSGGASAAGAVAKGDKLTLEASGGAELKLREVEAKSVEAEGSGGATLELQGSAEELTLDVSGGTRFPLEKLAVKSARIDASGGCMGELQASETVKGELSGASMVRVHGGARTRVATSGASSVETD